MIKQRQILGILGACLAVGGGITWFLHQYLFASILWAIAGIIVWKLNKMKKKTKKR
jgi:4-hydroxybenzoate polyprenyltransferase